MTLVASTIPTLVSGISQQPAPSRLRTSGERMENAFPSVVAGLMKRPPSQFVAELSSAITVDETAAVHMIDRSATEKYILVCGNGDLELFDDQGVAQTVTFPDGKSYLPATNPGDALRFVTVADTTFVLNRAATVIADDAGGESRPNPRTQASVFIKQAVASVAYAIYVDGVLAATFTTDTNTSAATALEGTQEIAAALAADAVTKGYTDAVAVGTTVVFAIADGEVVTVADQFGGRAMSPYTDTLQAFEDLPPQEVEGRLVKIQGNLEDRDTAYWVEYNAGIWTETYAPFKGIGLINSTMPHVLAKTISGDFEFRQGDWAVRTVGDSDSNPNPSFAGTTINNLFLFKGRLGFLSEENVILSEVGSLENFYRTTVIQSLSSDLIDVASATGRVSTLYHTASFSDELILFSDKQQFRLSSGNTLDAATVGITSTTSFSCSTRVNPVTVGSSAFFVADGVTNTIVRELVIDQDRQTVEGEDISIQVPDYIPKNVTTLAASTAADVFFALSSDTPNELYVYKWFDSDKRKIQTAWSKWVFDGNITIVGAGFLDRYLYLVYKVGAEIRFDRINIATTIDVDLLLDHQLDHTSFSSFTYDGGADETTIVLPVEHPSTFEFYKMDLDAFEPYSEGPTVTKVNDSTYTIAGDVTADTITAGVNYEFIYRFSNQYLREENSAGESAIQDGRLQLMYFSVIYTDTSYFEAHVTPTNGTTSVTVFNGRTLADPDNVTDLIPRDTGEFKFPIFAQNEEVVIELRNDQPYRCSFGSVEWTANYRPKAKRVK